MPSATEIFTSQRFQIVVDRHQGDRRVHALSCRDQLLALMFAQRSGRQSLRDLSR
ncbi:DUF4372 domain-containing protein [uncultured Amphritea sp.]|uniref:DUF4372 domain-containing protein n=1 Tax=uncultured Amphritea sp. TaxID=981605 RepID=UPI00344CD81B